MKKQAIPFFLFFYWQIKVKARRQEAGRLLSSHLDKSFCLSSRPMVPTKPTQKARGHCHFQCWVLFLSFLPAEPVESGSLLLGYFTSPLHSRPVCVCARTHCWALWLRTSLPQRRDVLKAPQKLSRCTVSHYLKTRRRGRKVSSQRRALRPRGFLAAEQASACFCRARVE